MAQATGVPPGSHVVEGLQIPVMFSADAVRSAINYKPRDDDVFIVTFPKCGTTWTSQVVALILRQGEPFTTSSQFFTDSPFLELVGATGVENMQRPGATKTHLPFRATPWSDKAKYIYVTRNPKDCCVSYFHHVNNMPGHGDGADFDEFFEKFISGTNDYGDYFDHVMEWYKHRNDPNVLFLTYEEMKKDIEAVIFRLASFIDDEKFAEPMRKNPEILKKIMDHSSFKSMKVSVNKFMDDMFGMSKEDISKSDLPDAFKKLVSKVGAADEGEKKENPKTSNFVRKGIVGDWKNHFSAEQSKRLDEKFAERTKGTELYDLWKQYMS